MKTQKLVFRALYCVPLLMFSQAEAAILAGTSSGLGIDIDLGVTLVGVTTDVGVGPFATANVSAPTPNTQNAEVLNLDADIGALGAVGNVSASEVSASASSDVDGTSNSGSASGLSSITDFELVIVEGVLGADDLFSISTGAGTVITSTSSSTGSYGALSSTGSIELADVTISVAGVNFNLDSSYAANTTLDISAAGVTGITILLNEQTQEGDGVEYTWLTTNAIRVVFDALDLESGLGVANGEFIIGQSFSSITAVPEPVTTGYTAFGALLFLVRRRR
ncbi:hypothetical protein [Rubritalea sp.]|uniref:hypothetical protein n=1 Tax=Rubritalea sp. TaxID=2109375 RepID=UPI003EF68FFE